MRACWLKWVGRDWSISADYIWLNYSGANNANRTRKDFVADEVLQMVWDRVYEGKPKPVVGVYRLTMKSNCVSSRGFEQKEHRKLSSLSIGSAHAC